MGSIFKKLNGWKTVIGLGFIGVGAVVKQFDPATGEMIMKIGEALTVVGVAHKAMKLS